MPQLTNRRCWKLRLLAGLTVLSLIGNAILAYQVLDLGISLSYSRDSVEYLSEDCDAAVGLAQGLLAGKRSRTEFDNYFHAGDVDFFYKGDHMVIGNSILLNFDEYGELLSISRRE